MPFTESSQLRDRILCVFLLIILFDSTTINAANYDLVNAEISDKDHNAANPSSSEDISETDIMLYPTSHLRESEETEDNLDKRRQAFLPMRGKKEPYWKNSEHLSNVEMSSKRGGSPSQSNEEIIKRGMGFLPMRGRKSFDYLSYLRQLQSQSALLHPGLGSNQLGFLLQKDRFKPNVLEKSFVPYEEVSDKRVSGFFGMRGKRRLYPRGFSWHGFQDSQSGDQLGGAKREALFFASRGKRTQVDNLAASKSTSE